MLDTKSFSGHSELVELAGNYEDIYVEWLI